ncbi:MAG: winged-helix domain-containing protein [Dehalococcoidia bacterium]
MASEDPPTTIAATVFDIPPAALLVIESAVVPGLRASVRGTPHTLTVAPDVDAVLRLLDTAEFDVVILDLDIPDAVEAIRAIRECTAAPLLGVGDGSIEQLIEMYSAGLDECVPRENAEPVQPLFARAAALLRLRVRPHGGVTLFGPDGLALQLRSREVRFGAEIVELAALEFDLLEALLRRRGEVLDADEISRIVWGHETFGDRNYVEALVSRLRRKLARAGARRVVTTVRGVGYTIR